MDIISKYISKNDQKERIENQFLRYFLSEYYLHYDRFLNGAEKFIRQLYIMGVEVIFLTGRTKSLMKHGTLDIIQKCGTTLNNTIGKLIMKPEVETHDQKFKCETMDCIISKRKNKCIIFIDNEGSICESIKKEYIHVFVWHFLSSQSINCMFDGQKLTRWKSM